MRVRRPLSSAAARALLVAVGLTGSITALALGEEPAAAGPRRLYLDEFRPEPSLIVDRQTPARAKFPCVNVHVHPGRLSPEQLDAAVAVMDAGNVAVSVSLDGQSKSFAEHYAQLTQRHPGRWVVFLRMDYVGDGDPEDPSTWEMHRDDFGIRMADRLTEAVRQGASGLKLLKELGLVHRDRAGNLIRPDDPRFDPVWQRAGELGVPVLWHCADPVAFFRPIDERNERWEELHRHPEWSFHGGDFPSHQELIDARNRVIARHPQTNFICAHFADVPEDLAKLSGYLDAHPNMYVEFAARIAELGRQPFTARKFFLKHPDRILFGTDGVPPKGELDPHFQWLETADEDFPYEDDPVPPQGRWNIFGMNLPDDVLRQVYFENAARLIPGVQPALDAYAANHPEAAGPLTSEQRSPARWEADIRAYEDADRAAPPAPGGVLFVGSSSIRLWDLEQSFPGQGYLNRGFGGCEASDVVHFSRRIILPYRPRIIVVYAGDNDLAAGKSAEQTASDFRALAAFIQEHLPEARTVYVPIKPSPARWTLFRRQRAANALIEDFCLETPGFEYVDTATPMLGADGQPRSELYVEDGLHLSPEGYELWSRMLRPLLRASGPGDIESR